MDLKRKAEQGALVPLAKKTRQEVSVYGGDAVSNFFTGKILSISPIIAQIWHYNCL